MNFKQLCNESGLKRPAIAKALGVSESTLYNYLSGATTPRIGTVKQLEDICKQRRMNQS